jgi:hypothetical protein
MKIINGYLRVPPATIMCPSVKGYSKISGLDFRVAPVLISASMLVVYGRVVCQAACRRAGYMASFLLNRSDCSGRLEEPVKYSLFCVSIRDFVRAPVSKPWHYQRPAASVKRTKSPDGGTNRAAGSTKWSHYTTKGVMTSISYNTHYQHYMMFCYLEPRIATYHVMHNTGFRHIFVS